MGDDTASAVADHLVESYTGRYGWRRVYDPGEVKYAVGRHLKLPEAPKHKSRHYRSPRVFDQGTSGSVGYAWWQWLDTTRGRQTEFVVSLLTETTLHGVARALQAAGELAGYYWTRDVNIVKRALYAIGPVVMGTDWQRAMLQPRPDGLMLVSGPVVGAQAWVVVGYDPRRQAFRGVNSWGPGWAQVGRFWMAEKDFAKLLKDGVACVPMLAI